MLVYQRVTTINAEYGEFWASHILKTCLRHEACPNGGTSKTGSNSFKHDKMKHHKLPVYSDTSFTCIDIYMHFTVVDLQPRNTYSAAFAVFSFHSWGCNLNSGLRNLSRIMLGSLAKRIIPDMPRSERGMWLVMKWLTMELETTNKGYQRIKGGNPFLPNIKGGLQKKMTPQPQYRSNTKRQDHQPPEWRQREPNNVD